MADPHKRLEFLPPAAAHLGREFVRFDAERSEVVLRYHPRQEFVNRHGFVQGGFLSAMLDSGFSCALLPMLDEEQSSVTLEMKTSFHRPVRPEPVTVTCRVVHRGGTVAFSDGELRDSEGNLAVTGSATLRIVKRRGAA